MDNNVKRSTWILILVFGATVGLIQACSKEHPVDCIEPEGAKPKVQKVNRYNIGKTKKTVDPNADWCRTCVMGPKGWASCQIAFGEKMGEDRNAIKARSRENACLDAGFKKGECPDSAVKAVTCKGDPPPEGIENPSETLQKMFIKSEQNQADEKAQQSPPGDNSGENSNK